MILTNPYFALEGQDKNTNEIVFNVTANDAPTDDAGAKVACSLVFSDDRRLRAFISQLDRTCTILERNRRIEYRRRVGMTNPCGEIALEMETLGVLRPGQNLVAIIGEPSNRKSIQPHEHQMYTVDPGSDEKCCRIPGCDYRTGA